MADKNSGDKLLYCSFCGKSQHEVRKLIAGPSVFICDECIELCNDIIKEEGDAAGAGQPAKDKLPTPHEISVSEPNLPPVDTEFARGYGIADGNLERLHEEIGANLKLELKRRIIARIRDQVMEALRKSTPVTVPQALVEMDIQRQMQQAATDLKSRGGEPTSEQLRPEMFREAAASRVSLGLLIGELVKQHSLDATPEQVRVLVEESAQSYEQPEEVIKWHYQDRKRLADFESQALEQNVIDWVSARCQVKELQTSFAELTGVTG